MILRRESRCTRRKSCSTATLSTTKPTPSSLRLSRVFAVLGQRLTAWAIQQCNSEEKSCVLVLRLSNKSQHSNMPSYCSAHSSIPHQIQFCPCNRKSGCVLVNKANLAHNLFLVYLSISICFERLCVHHQEKQVCLCDTWYLLFCVADCLVYRVHNGRDM